MGKGNKNIKYTPEQTRKFELRYKVQPFKQKVNEVKYEWVDITFYMLDHDRFKSLSVYATKLYLYMRQWAYKSDMWLETGQIEYARSMMPNHKIMSAAQSYRALTELWEKGFIDKVLERGRKNTNKWAFSDRWYKGGRQEF